MPLEIEVKLKLDSHDAVRDRLHSLNAQRLGKVRETNTFFDRHGELRAKDSGLRVRFARNLEPGPDHPALITFKGPAASAGLHAREALDIHCDPAEQVIPLIQSLGFQQVMSFEKDRESWKLDDCLIELDTLPHFGTFLEIEGPKEEIVHSVQQKLALASLPQVTDSYSKMVGSLLRQRNETALRF